MKAALDLLARVPSILVFLAALTVVSECCSASGLFDALAAKVVSWTRGRVLAAWAALMTASCLVTAFLSLDTTAVLMTTAAVAVARKLHRPVVAFVFPTLWIANMASMWLPVSNLTTLLARDVLPHPDTLSYVSSSWPVALTTTLVPLGFAWVIFRQHLRGAGDGSVASAPDMTDTTSTAAHTSQAHATDSTTSTDNDTGNTDTHASPDPLLQRLITLIVVAMSLALLVIEPAIAATVAAFACYIALWWRQPKRRREVTLPWSSLAMTTGLFALVAVLHGFGVLNRLTDLVNDGPAWHLALAGGATANAVNNLPAYLALEPAAHGHPTRILALLVGVNVASGLTWWGSVATLLWRDRLNRAGETVTLRMHLMYTGAATVLTTSAALVVLSLTQSRH